MPDFTVPASALAYCYADQLTSAVVGRTALDLDHQLPCRDAKAKRKDVVTLVFTAALVHLARRGAIRMETGTRGALIKRKYVLVTLATRALATAGIEAALLAEVSGKAKDDGAGNLVARLLGKDRTDPWGHAVSLIQESLVELGLFAESERRGLGKLMGKDRTPVCDRVLALQAQVPVLKGLLSEFRAAQGPLYEQLWKDIGSGLASRQDKPDVDLD